MILKIHHLTTYKYAREVFIEPHHLYFHPAQRNYFRVLDFSIKIQPEPSGLTFRMDAENNPYYQTWFNELVSHFEVEVEIMVETIPINPFDLLIEDHPKVDHTEALQIYLRKEPLADETCAWAKEIREMTGENLITFFTYLTKSIKADWIHEDRYVENIMLADECFQAKKGSCRDLAWMLIQLLRNCDIPARFVSGYAFNPELTAGHELHAWVEAWAPGAGWIGLDPSTGLFTTDQYIPIAASHKPQNTFPVQGSYRGAADAELSFQVKLHAE